jgi:4'-phosphopantetheinyl transferase
LLWRVDLDAFEGVQDVCTEEERNAAQRFRFPQLRRRALAARHALRTVLGAAMACDPRSLAIKPGAFGKPRLASPAPAWHFNLSHSQGLGLIGLRRAGPVGVDIEVLMDRNADQALLVQRLFTQAEQCEWRAAPDADRIRLFLSAWTRKEACLKALGTGLALEAKAVDAGCAPAPRLVRMQAAGTTGEVCVWSIAVDVPALAAVAVTDTEWARLVCDRLA